jgi:hypothetical protein
VTWDILKTQQRDDEIIAVRGNDRSPLADSLVGTSPKGQCNGFYIVRTRVGRSKSLNQPECNKGCCIVMVKVVIKRGLSSVDLKVRGRVYGEGRESCTRENQSKFALNDITFLAM